jgi:hypothetical protein
MVMKIEKASIHLSLEEAAVSAGYKVLMEVGDNILLIVTNPQGILDQNLRPNPYFFTISLNNFKKLRTVQSGKRPLIVQAGAFLLL